MDSVEGCENEGKSATLLILDNAGHKKIMKVES
jgi:hypothetical protein